MWLIILIALGIIIYLRYKIIHISKYRKLDKFNHLIKECEIGIYKIRMTEEGNFNKLLQIQKDLYAKHIRPSGLQNPKYFKKKTPFLTLDDILISSIDIWHLDTLSFWSTCEAKVGDNLNGINSNTLHRTLVFSRYKNILTGSLGEYLQKLKIERLQCLRQL